ncbi:hypothetical protein ACFOGJ_16265 [Marinibaculum pumilum]|uniref:Uncharacterized protein n=1 Tax=Marinibaculum pumilum TaxID=1766165 RepID=A0ABV7L2F6_9PROT
MWMIAGTRRGGDMLEMLFSALFGGATGLIGTVIGKVFGWLELREKRKNMVIEQAHELALFDRQASLRRSEMENEAAIADTAAWQAGRVESYRHDMAAGETYKWVASIIRLTRPVLTLLLIGLTAYVFIRVGDLGIQADITAQIVYLASMAVAWWFGDRAPQQRR